MPQLRFRSGRPWVGSRTTRQSPWVADRCPKTVDGPRILVGDEETKRVIDSISSEEVESSIDLILSMEVKEKLLSFLRVNEYDSKTLLMGSLAFTTDAASTARSAIRMAAGY